MTIMIGIDPHKATHTAVAIDSDEQVLDEFTVRASHARANRLRTWASQFDDTASAVCPPAGWASCCLNESDRAHRLRRSLREGVDQLVEPVGPATADEWKVTLAQEQTHRRTNT